MEDKVRIKNLKSLFEFFEKFSREGGQMETHVQLMYRVLYSRTITDNIWVHYHMGRDCYPIDDLITFSLSMGIIRQSLV